MIVKKSLGNKLICIFFFLMLILPASFQVPRGVLLLIILFFCAYSNPLSTFKYDKTLLFIGLINIFFSFLFIVNGIIRSAPGAIPVSTVYVIWPILYFFIIGLSDDKLKLLPILRTIIYGGLGATTLILIFIINNFIGFPINITYLAKSQDFSIWWGLGAVELNSMNLATVLYVFVFVFALLLMPSKLNNLCKKNFLRFTLFICLVLLFISSRRAFWIVCAISPIIILLLLKFSGINLNLKRFVIPGVIFFSILFVFFGFLALDNDNLVTELSSSFEFDNPEAESNYLRKEQYTALMNGWEENTIFGAGLGAAAKGSVRDINSPWAYELSYIALLFQTGIIGFCIYTLSVFWIIIKSIKLCRRSNNYVVYLIPQIAGMICFLLANASNPYLAKFDYLWTIFLPVATINALQLDFKHNSV